MTSPDGLNWTGRNAAAANEWIAGIWAKELGIVAAVSGGSTAAHVQWSANGINWNQVGTIDNSLKSIAWSPKLKLFAACSITGPNNRILTSPNGTVWTARTTNSNDWQSIIWTVAPEKNKKIHLGRKMKPRFMV